MGVNGVVRYFTGNLGENECSSSQYKIRSITSEDEIIQLLRRAILEAEDIINSCVGYLKDSVAPDGVTLLEFYDYVRQVKADTTHIGDCSIESGLSSNDIRLTVAGEESSVILCAAAQTARSDLDIFRELLGGLEVSRNPGMEIAGP